MTDVLIAGGGPAGASLAIQLGRAGFTVELHDRAKFPREKVCGEGLMPAGAGALARLGVQVEGTPFPGIRYLYGSLSAEGRFPETPGLPNHGLGIRRLHLDVALFKAAAGTPGVRAFENSQVEQLILHKGTVCGARVNGVEHSARLVVAADGVHSRLRRQLGLDCPTPRDRIGLRAHFRLAADRAAPAFVEIYLAQGHELYITPLPSGELQVAVLGWRDWSPNPARDAFRAAIASQAKLAAMLEGAEQISEIQGVCPLAGVARERVTDGCVLLGDAAGFLDPITGGGLTQALLASEMLAQQLKAKFESTKEYLKAYDVRREAMLADYRRLTAMVLSAAAWPKLFPHWLRFLQLNPAIFSHAIGVSAGVRRLVPGLRTRR